MSASAAMKLCGAETRSGKPCENPAGHRTGHPGRGPCSKHTGSTPAQERNAAREAAYDFVVGQMGYEMQIDPLEAATMAVSLAAGAVAYWRVQMSEAYGKGEQPTVAMLEGYRVAMLDLGRMADNASKAGVAERLIAITERMAEQIALAFEDALNGEKIPPEQRARVVQKFGQGLLTLEAGMQAPQLPAAA